MKVFKIWNKRVAKFKKTMFKIKKSSWLSKRARHAKYKFELTYTTSAIFSTSYVLTFSPICLNGFLFLTTSLPELFVC